MLKDFLYFFFPCFYLPAILRCTCCSSQETAVGILVSQGLLLRLASSSVSQKVSSFLKYAELFVG